MSLKDKRFRSINWDEEEKQLFRTVLKEFAAKIENKSLDNNANKLKSKAWEEVHKKFNELNGRLRSLNQLKIQWKTMKINARKEISLFKRASNKTGGGGRPHTPTNDVIEIKDLLNPAELLRDVNLYDSDGIIVSASTSKDLSASEKCIFTLQDNNENIFQTDLSVSENIHLRKQEADTKSVATVLEDHIPAASQESKNDKPAESQDSITSINSKVYTPNKQTFTITPKKQKNAPSCSAKSNNYVNSMVNFSKGLKEIEHQKRLEILEVELNIQKEKLKSAILEREILELRKAKELL